MWTVIIFLLLWCQPCTVSTAPPSPINVSFSSVNLRNVLEWSSGDGTSDDTVFTVEYAIYGESIAGSKGRRVHWRAVQKCTEIDRTWCDLSLETQDEEQGYHARVRAVRGRASSKWVPTRRRFDPKLDTTFGPPLVSVELQNNSIIIALKGPMKHPSQNHSSVISLADIYPQMTYDLSINNIDRNLILHIPVVATPYKYRLTDYNTRYCFSARAQFLSMPIRCQPSAWHCITTPQDPVIEQLRKVIVSIVVPALCIGVITLVCYSLYRYLMGKGHKSPYILNTSSLHLPPVFLPLENPNHIFISIIRNVPPSEPEGCEHECRIADSPPKYSLQTPQAQPGELLDDSSVEYGFVSAAPTNDGRRSEDEAGEECTCSEEEIGAEEFPNTGASTQEMCCRLLQAHLLPHSPTHPQSEKNPVLKPCVWSHLNPCSLAQNHLPLQSFQDPAEVNKKQDERPGLCPERNPQTGLFKIFEQEEIEGEDINEGLMKDEGNNPENAPLLSAHASQNSQKRPASSNYLPNAYAALTSDPSLESEEEDYYYYQEEPGSICVEWDPETRKLILPKVQMIYEGKLNGWRASEDGSKERIGAEGQESFVAQTGLKLENVYVRQGSEEEAEACREMEMDGQSGDDILTKWNLSISMGE